MSLLGSEHWGGAVFGLGGVFSFLGWVFLCCFFYRVVFGGVVFSPA